MNDAPDPKALGSSQDASALRQPSSQKPMKVAIVAPSLRYVGGQAVQADLLMRLWQNDPEVEVSFIAVDPPLPGVSRLGGAHPGSCAPSSASPFISGTSGAASKTSRSRTSFPRPTGRSCLRPPPHGFLPSRAARKVSSTTAAEKPAITCNAFAQGTSCCRAWTKSSRPRAIWSTSSANSG